MSDTEIDIRLASKDFDSAVSDFLDRKPLWHGQTARWRDGLYSSVRAAVTATGGRRPGSRVYGSRPPGRIDVIAWTVAVDGEVSRWGWQFGAGGGTPHVLAGLAARSWTPEDAGEVVRMRDKIRRWCVEAADLLGLGEVRVPIRTRCPACGERWAYTGVGQDRHRVDALVIHGERGVDCGACRAHWPPEHYGLLGALLGCEPVLA